MKPKNSLKLIYKLPSSYLKEHKWNVDLPFAEVEDKHPDFIVSIGDSQVLRWIDELNGVKDAEGQIADIKEKLKLERRKRRSRSSQKIIRELYNKLHSLEFKEDYLCVVMNSPKDYLRANKGFTVNGIKYRRFVGTNGGVKTSTIVYVSDRLYPALKKRVDNGRNMEAELVPAKLEAYQALVCSASTPVPSPKGFIVVKDCITHFKEDVIRLDDSTTRTPTMEFMKDYEVEHNDSDGFGLMSPTYATTLNEYLNGISEPLTGCNTRASWTKGMLYTFDFLEFAERVAGTYEVVDVWGHKRDIRDADVILTESMLKLWNCYDSWEDYQRSSAENHYEFCVAKDCPEELEGVRTTNYQFLQDLPLSDDDIDDLCRGTITEIKDVLGGDWRKSICYLAGYGLNDRNVWTNFTSQAVKALMAEPDMINDPYIRSSISSMIKTRMNNAKHGTIQIHGNFVMISGDPYALAQSMFGMDVTGILKKGEVYHRYWIDKGTKEICCFRAPMTCANNIRKMKLNNSPEALHWYQYIRTALIYNAWDTSCEAMNGADKDGDTNLTTDDPTLLKSVHNDPTIICVQKKASKKIPTEDDIVQGNILAFNDDIGVVTNHVTSMIERLASFREGSKEYKELRYRILCGQLYQQNSIDRIKGVVCKPMPSEWYNVRDCIVKDEDDGDEETIKRKSFNRKIVANVKPYFMIYIYPKLKKQYKTHETEYNNKVVLLYGKDGILSIDDLRKVKKKTDYMKRHLRNYDRFNPVGQNPCVVNRICKKLEYDFQNIKTDIGNKPFDYSILKSNSDYSQSCYNEISNLYKSFQKEMSEMMSVKTRDKMTSFDAQERSGRCIEKYKRKCYQICNNEDELCDIVADLCYGKNKSKLFAWSICGDLFIRNLLRRHSNVISYPKTCNESEMEFLFNGTPFKLETKEVDIAE